MSSRGKRDSQGDGGNLYGRVVWACFESFEVTEWDCCILWVWWRGKSICQRSPEFDELRRRRRKSPKSGGGSRIF